MGVGDGTTGAGGTAGDAAGTRSSSRRSSKERDWPQASAAGRGSLPPVQKEAGVSCKWGMGHMCWGSRA